MMPTELGYKPDWSAARAAWQDWWEHKGLALCVTAPKDKPWEVCHKPDSTGKSMEFMWWDPGFWTQSGLHHIANGFYGGAAFPIMPTWISGPVCLGVMLGGEARIENGTVWLHPVIHDPDTHPPLRIDRDGVWWRRHWATITEAVRCVEGRGVACYPDIEGAADALSGLRGQDFLTDFIERPDWVHEKLHEANVAFQEMYEDWWPMLRDSWGGSSIGIFGVWAPGRTVKMQCDMSCMLSPAMFDEFVVPSLRQQCQRLDYVYYHLDGTTALQHLDSLLAIEAIDAIEWTPQAGLPQGGAPEWYDLYRRIKAAGKSVHAFGVASDEIEPLIKAVGADGVCITTTANTETEARALLRRFGWKA
ncbi:MAG: hypothetical protein WCO98_05630 [bacterium]